MAAYTPGPWRAVQDALGHWAILWPHGTERAVARKVYSEEDARLVAAAPSLLDVLKRFAALDDGDEPFAWKHAGLFDEARSLITLCEKEAPPCPTP